MSLDAAILGFLGERPRSGYDLKTRCFDDAVKDFWTADQAQIYRTLDRLQAAKLVTVSRKRQTGRPDRKVYSLTDLGRRTLSAWLSSQVPMSPPRDAFLLQMYFAAESSDSDLATHFRTRRIAHQERLEHLRSNAAAAAQDPSVPARQASLRDAAFSGAMAMERAVIDWLDDCIEGLQAGTLPPAGENDEQHPRFGPTTA
jgi:DNA-binding PadR family transcriptional regulator